MKLLLALVVLAIPSCKLSDRRPELTPEELFVPSFTGYDSQGHARTCVVEHAAQDSCPPLSESEEQFREQCVRQGKRLEVCSCDVVLCSGKVSDKK